LTQTRAKLELRQNSKLTPNLNFSLFNLRGKGTLCAAPITAMESNMAPPNTTKDQLSCHFDGAPADAFIEIWRKDAKQSAYLPIAASDQAAEMAMRAAPQEDVYFCIGAIRTAKPSSTRARIEDVCWLPSFYLDLDLSDPAKPAKCLPQNAAEALGELSEIGLPAPWLVVSTGNGLAAHFRFDTPLTFKTEAEARAGHDRISKLSANILAALADRRGWQFDNVGQVNRLTRPISTLNRKSHPPKPVSFHSGDPSATISLTELEMNFPGEKSSVAAGPSGKRPRTNSNQAQEPAGRFDVTSVERSCAWIANAVSCSASLGEPEWYAAGRFYADTWEAEDRFHDLSSQHPGYDRVETAAKLQQAKRAAPPRTCATIARDFGTDHCSTCIFKGQINSPAALGYGNPTLIDLQCRYVFVATDRRYVDLETGNRFDPQGFSDKFMHLTGEPMHQALRNSALTVKADREEYHPGDRRRVIRSEHEVVCNTYRAGGVEPLDGDWSIIRQQLELFIPDLGYRERFYDRTANLVQHPDVKNRSAALITGVQGTGKNFVAHLYQQILGAANVKVIPGEALVSKYTAELVGCVALFLEELRAFSTPETYEALKHLISEDTARVEEKYRSATFAATPRSVIAFSNHAAPIKLGDGDRRFDVYASPMVPCDPGYYEHLWSKGLAQAPAFKAWLLRRDVSQFNPSAPPPITDAKAALLADSRPAVEKALEAMIAEGVTPFSDHRFTISGVRSALNDRRVLGIGDDRGIVEFLKKMGARSLGQRSVAGSRSSYWTFDPQIADAMSSRED
jgi:hypothetical protein